LILLVFYYHPYQSLAKSGVFRLSPDNQTDNRLDNKTATGTDFLL